MGPRFQFIYAHEPRVRRILDQGCKLIARLSLVGAGQRKDFYLTAYAFEEGICQLSVHILCHFCEAKRCAERRNLETNISAEVKSVGAKLYWNRVRTVLFQWMTYSQYPEEEPR